MIFSKLKFWRKKDYLQDYPRPCEHPVKSRITLENLQVLCNTCGKQMSLHEILESDHKMILKVIDSL